MTKTENFTLDEKVEENRVIVTFDSGEINADAVREKLRELDGGDSDKQTTYPRGYNA